MSFDTEAGEAIWHTKCPHCGVEYQDHAPPDVTSEELQAMVHTIVEEAGSQGVAEEYISAESFRRFINLQHERTKNASSQ